MLSIAYSTILVAHYIKIATFKIIGFFIIIIYRVRVVSFKITSLTAAATKLRSFFKKIIGAHIAGGQIEIVF